MPFGIHPIHIIIIIPTDNRVTAVECEAACGCARREELLHPVRFL
jgi:hypothetical protein